MNKVTYHNCIELLSKVIKILDKDSDYLKEDLNFYPNENFNRLARDPFETLVSLQEKTSLLIEDIEDVYLSYDKLIKH